MPSRRNIWCNDQKLDILNVVQIKQLLLLLSRALHQALCPIAKGAAKCHISKFPWGWATYFSDSSYKLLAPAFQTTWHQADGSLDNSLLSLTPPWRGYFWGHSFPKSSDSGCDPGDTAHPSVGHSRVENQCASASVLTGTRYVRSASPLGLLILKASRIASWHNTRDREGLAMHENCRVLREKVTVNDLQNYSLLKHFGENNLNSMIKVFYIFIVLGGIY